MSNSQPSKNLKMSAESIVLGGDRGGTYTDFVAVDPSGEILKTIKVLTTKDVYSGMTNGLKKLFENDQGLCQKNIKALHFGSTALLNTVLEASEDLRPVALFRLCGKASDLIPPFCGFNKVEPLLSRIHLAKYLCSGGYELSQEETMPINKEELKQHCEHLYQLCKAKQLQKVHIVISACFSTSIDYESKPNQEVLAMHTIEEAMKSKGIETSFTLSQDFVGTKLLPRENTAILNESLKVLAEKHINAYKYALKSAGLSHVSFHLVQNDGTLISCEEALRFPVKTFFSGPCNSIKGAYELSKLKRAIVIDIGGTSSDVSKIIDGEANLQVTNIAISSVSTNLIANKSNSIGLGGGSIVEINEETGQIRVGPKSIGYDQKKAISFGGDVLTALDIAIGLGIISIEGAQKERVNLPEATLRKVYNHYVAMIQACINELVNEKEAEIPLVLVGGGSVLINLDQKFKGVNKIIRPENFESASAYGATFAKVSYTIDRMYFAGSTQAERDEKLKALEEEAVLQLVARGGVKENCKIIKEVFPLTYMKTNGFVRSLIIAISELDYSKMALPSFEEIKERENLPEPSFKCEAIFQQLYAEKKSVFDYSNLELDKPHRIEVRDGRRVWVLSWTDIVCMAIGGAFTGSGGGGSPVLLLTGLSSLIKDYPNLEFLIIGEDSFKEEDLLCFFGTMGSPYCQGEKLLSSNELMNGIRFLEKYFNAKINVVTCAEIGGSNVLTPLVLGAFLGRYVLDADGFGRAYPIWNHFYPFIKGIRSNPFTGADPQGNVFMLANSTTLSMTETFMRQSCENLGSRLGCTIGPYSKSEILPGLIKNSFSRVWRLGNLILKAKKEGHCPMEALAEAENAQEIFTGSVVRKHGINSGGFFQGICELEGQKAEAKKVLKLDYQNEFLIATEIDKVNQSERVLAQVPHIITLVDYETFDPIMTSELAYGQLVRVIVLPAVEEYLAEDVMKVAGPEAFGYPSKPAFCPKFKNHDSEIRQK